MLAYLMYLSAPVPWVISEPELVGRPLAFVAAVLVLFGVFKQFLVIPTIAALPIPWGVSLPIWMIAKGLNPAALGSTKRRSVPSPSTALVSAAG